MLETRDISINGAARTAFHESIFTVSITPGNVRIVRLLFGDEALNVQLEGACPDYGDIQEISGSPSERGGFEKQWDGFRYYLCMVQPANLEPGCLKAWGGIAKMKSGLEIKVLYWFTPLDSVEDSLISIQRTEKQCLDFCMKQNLKDEEYRKEFERKEAEDRALALEREKEQIAFIIAQTEAIKQPAAAPETPMTEHEALACLNISDKTLKRYCDDLGFDTQNLTAGKVESIKNAMAKKRKRDDVARRNKKSGHAKYDGIEGCKEKKK